MKKQTAASGAMDAAVFVCHPDGIADGKHTSNPIEIFGCLTSGHF
jgi:hypothetical protein